MFKIEEKTLNNELFRKVISTNNHSQLVIMSIKDNIPTEIHPNIDQFFKVEDGQIEVYWVKDNFINKEIASEGESITIPANTYHEVVNIGDKPAKLYTIYSYAKIEDAPH